MIPLPVVFAAIAAVAAFTGAWQIQDARFGKQIADIQRNAATAALKQIEKAHAETLRLQQTKDAALLAAADRQRAMARSAAALRSERDGLRDDLAAASRAMPDASCDAVREYATAANTVFGLCADRLERLAGEAAGHASDSLTLQGAWPVSQSKPDEGAAQ